MPGADAPAGPRRDGCKGRCPRPTRTTALRVPGLRKSHATPGARHPCTQHGPAPTTRCPAATLALPASFFMTRHLLPWATCVPRTHRWRPPARVRLYLGQGRRLSRPCGRECALEACPPLGAGPLAGRASAASLPLLLCLSVSSETGHPGGLRRRLGTDAPPCRLRLPCAGFAAVLGDVAAPGPALATSTALESQAGGSQLRAGASRAVGHSLGLRAGVRPPAPREEPPEGAGEWEPPHRTPGVGRRPFSGPPEGHGALSPVRAGWGPGTHQAHVVTAGGAGAGRSVRVQDPILKADSAGHAAVGRGAAAALPPSAETDPASRTFRPSPP